LFVRALGFLETPPSFPGDNGFARLPSAKASRLLKQVVLSHNPKKSGATLGPPDLRGEVTTTISAEYYRLIAVYARRHQSVHTCKQEHSTND
jgi:hypothetical protein